MSEPLFNLEEMDTLPVMSPSLLTKEYIAKESMKILDNNLTYLAQLCYEPAPPSTRWERFWYYVRHLRPMPKMVPKKWDLPIDKRGGVVRIRVPKWGA